MSSDEEDRDSSVAAAQSTVDENEFHVVPFSQNLPSNGGGRKRAGRPAGAKNLPRVTCTSCGTDCKGSMKVCLCLCCLMCLLKF